MNNPLRSTLACTAALFLGLYAGAAHADPAVIITAPFDGTASGRGASVSGGGEWSIVTDGPDQCDLRVYRRNWLTMGWGTGTGGTDETPFDIVTNNSPATCTDGNFGNSSSLSGEMLVLGVNSWDSISNFCAPSVANAGAILVYTWNGQDFGAGGAWDRRASGNCVNAGEVIVAGDPQDLTVADDRQVDAAFGTSVSVNQISANEYLIAVGEPGFDDGLNVDAGRVSVYRYVVGGSLTTDTITRVGTDVGDNAGDRLGSAVTTNFPYGLAGAPGVEGAGTDGYLKVWEVVGNNLGAPTLFAVPLDPGAELGREVSLSDDLLLASGDATAFVWENTAGNGNPANYQLLAIEPVSLGGDVSQANGITAFGINDANVGGAEIYRNVASDGVNDLILADVAGDVGGELDDIGIDIRLVDESLWFANEARDAATPANRAILYQYPAGYGGFNAIPFAYYQRSLPCDLSGQTVQDVFGYLGTLGVDYDVFTYDDTDVTLGRPYTQLAPTDSLDERYFVWLATATPQYVPMGACDGFTVPDRVDGIDQLIGDDILNPTPFVDTVRTQKLIPLPNAADPDGVDDGDPSDDFGRVMLNNPFPRGFFLQDVRYVTPAGDLGNLDDAQAGDFLLATVYVWDPENGAYEARTTTPGFGDRIEAHEGFWVRILPNGRDPQAADLHNLVVPQTD